MDDLDIGRLTDEIAQRVQARLTRVDLQGRILVPIGVSARHIHLTSEVLAALYGAGHQLRRQRDLSQVGEFAAEETVTVVGPNGRALEGVRILGPPRGFTQIELARSDGLRLGLDLPVRKTADLKGSPGVTIIGPAGTVVLREGAIRTTRHIHMSPEDARRFKLTDGQIVRARVEGTRAVTFENVIIRVGERFVLDFHIDTDDANASGAETGSFAEVLV
ncbi:MAG TPA: phosphate propanoyltransferase [bacterium]|nr:phosphate propanoyltransferase [bacterium]